MKDKKLRSSEWFGHNDKMGFVHRSWMRNQGHPDHMFDGKPVIGICNTWSDLTPCNAHLRDFAEIVKRGVYEAGGFPLEFPVMSLGETLMKPTTMLWRNLASMDTEESIRANPIDGVVLLTGCDKTTPSTIMGACSVDLPTIVVPGGPMLNGYWQGKKVGSGTLTWQLSEALVKGEVTGEEVREAESCMSRSAGHCMTMGTASSMACTVEALGLTLPNAAAIPAVDSRKKVMAHLAGNRIVEMVREDLKISKVLTREAFENAIKINAAIGGSTNVVLHLLAIARRLGVSLSLDDFDALASRLPMIVNLMPAGEHLMEDLFYAGGLSAVVDAMQQHLSAAITVNGTTLVENAKNTVNRNKNVIGDLDNPFIKEAGIAVLHGNLCEKGAVIKPCAASPHLMKHSGRAVVFESIEDYHNRINDPDLAIDKDCVMVLQGVGPVGYPGMPEVGNMTLPKKLLDQGVTDMVRISDGRMSGTAYGTVVLHVAPESAIGGTLALVRNGDIIALDVAKRSLHLEVSEEELAQRKKEWIPPQPQADRGYTKMYIENVNQADEGCDLDFLKGGSGAEVNRDLH
ncbi:MAG: dihydroxy-acid dehydratase [Bacteroidetes bacterium]|nr:dihydroxy-acid dehydratase [Bacteroidota bacterium]MDA0922830.1 dihydroxy-acid dehydratase [Bacteroidota bacterium]MDA1288975.1 dihydroxy-acid dehydratase [Bacteroidota bacterium]